MRTPLLIGLLGIGCGGGEPPKAAGEKPVYWAHSPPKCQADETREFFCDPLVPRRSSFPAPPPYDNCPASHEGHIGRFEPTPPVSIFDVSYTEYMRRRAPPGHNCCYSWCAPVSVPVFDPRAVWAACNTPHAFREEFCMNEPEGGTSRPAGGGFNRCPNAIVPPRNAAFAVPQAAPFDAQTTIERRHRGSVECCYAWCSQAPPASGIDGR